MAWLDDAHCYLLSGINTSAHTINTWFEHEGGDNLSPPTTSGYLRFGVEPRSRDLNALDFRFKIKVKLPALENRVELLLSDDEDEQNEQVLKAARLNNPANRESTVLALQFKNKESSKVSYRIGLGRGTQLYTRARYSDNLVLSPSTKVRYFTEANYYSSDQLGAEANAQVVLQLDDNDAFTLSNSFRYRSKLNDWAWRHEAQYIRFTNNNKSHRFSAMINGQSKPNYRKEQILLSYRYKQSVLRKWFYIEIEPFVLYLRKEDFRASVGIALRTEILFST